MFLGQLGEFLLWYIIVVSKSQNSNTLENVTSNIIQVAKGRTGKHANLFEKPPSKMSVVLKLHCWAIGNVGKRYLKDAEHVMCSLHVM